MTSRSSPALTPSQRQHLRERLETGLPHCRHPYQELALTIGATEHDVVQQVRHWQQQGLFRRFGLVVHHRRLGIGANVMLVLDVSDTQIHRLGSMLASEPDVNLCYQRRRQLPEWPYNLYCMIHGRDRSTVTARVIAMLSRLGLDTVPRQLLFSLRVFKQRGARYSPAAPHCNTPVAIPPGKGGRHE